MNKLKEIGKVGNHGSDKINFKGTKFEAVSLVTYYFNFLKLLSSSFP